jgi:hypothetical protein
VGNGTPYEAKVDALRSLKANGLDRAGGAALDLCEMRGENHVRAAFPDVEVILYRARRLPEIWAGDHVEDGFTIGRDLPRHGSEVTNPPADVAVDGNGAARVEAIGPSCTEDDDRGKEQATHSPQAIDEEKSDEPADEAEADVPRESTRESCHSRLGCASVLSLNAGRIRAATGLAQRRTCSLGLGPRR